MWSPSSPITDGASPLNFTKTGTDLWVLTNTANTYTGTTLVNQGTLRVTVHTAGSSPMQSPLHSPNSLAASGVALSETLEPAGNA